MITPQEIEMIDTIAQRLYRAGVFPKTVLNADVAFAILLKGHELGIQPMAAASGIGIVSGKVSLGADITAATVLRRRDVCLYFSCVETTDKLAHYTTQRAGAPEPVSLTYTFAQAQRAGLTSSGTWRAHTEAMLRARCAAALARAVYPDLVAGCYDPDEIDEIQGGRASDAAGSRVDPAQPAQHAQPAAPTRRALDVFRDALDRDDALAAIVVTWHAHCAAFASEGTADDADADVAKRLLDGGYHLTKSERQVLLARNWPPAMLALLDALAMQGAAPRVLRWRLDADTAKAIDALPEHHAKTVKTICARTWCVLSEIETDRPNAAFAKAVESARADTRPAPAEGPQEPAQPVEPVDPERAAIVAEMEPVAPVEAPVAAALEMPEALRATLARIAEIELPGEAIAVWMKHRAALATLTPPDREAAWKALCKRTEEVGKMKNAKVWLKKAIAEEDARRASDGGGKAEFAA